MRIPPRFRLTAATALLLILPQRSSNILALSAAPKKFRVGKSAANQIALDMGLNVVRPSPHYSPNKRKSPRNTKKDKSLPICIEWEPQVERFFWGNDDERNLPSGASLVETREKFPLVLLNVLSSSSLEQALQMVTSQSLSNAEEIEQHELVGQTPRTLRRSLVSQLDLVHNPHHCQLLQEMIVPRLPPALGGFANHPYEDGSIVYYRSGGPVLDFYHEHHDSYDRDEALRERQRAYTVLLYLVSPSGSPTHGGTEFTRLTPLFSKTTETMEGENHTLSGKRQRRRKGLVLKPRAGDALIWPNFDREGRPHMLSHHCALPLNVHSSSPQHSLHIPSYETILNHEEIGKIVVNLWFQGRTPAKQKSRS